MDDKLIEILEYYKVTYVIEESIEDIYDSLVQNNVEVNGNSFYCPIYNTELDAWLLLAGTKEVADTWVLKKIIRLIKTGDTIYTMFNGNSEHLIKMFSRYDLEVIEKKDNGIVYISFNKKET